MRRTLGTALTLLALFGRAGFAQNRVDTVVLRIEGPAGGTTLVSGSIRLRDGEEERKYNDVRTPFEIRLPAQPLEASFGAIGVRLSGEMTLLREGKQVGWVSGTSRIGHLRFYRTETGAYGFGSPLASRRARF